MSLAERLNERVPNNEDVILLRRTRINYDADKTSALATAKRRLIDSGSFDIVEELLELVEGSWVNFSEDNQPSGLPVLGNRSPFLGLGLYRGRDSTITYNKWVKIEFGWINKIRDEEEDISVSGEGSKSFLAITAPETSDQIIIGASSYDLAFLSDPIRFKYTLSREQYLNRELFENVIVEASVLAGLTKPNLKLKGARNE